MLFTSLQALKHEHQQARNNGHAARARELELRIQSLIEIWGLVEDEEEVRSDWRCDLGGVSSSASCARLIEFAFAAARLLTRWRIDS